MMIDLTDTVAIVTGGASGIGRGICLVLAEQGAKIAVADVNSEGAESCASEISDIGRQAIAIVTDVTDRGSVNNMVAKVLDTFHQIHILVNDAGLIGAPNWWERDIASDEDWDYALAVNLRGVVNVSQAVALDMKERRYGKIINIASIAARQGSPTRPPYHASKAAVMSWTQSHALELAPYNINVNAICPGLLWTPMLQRITQTIASLEVEPSLVERRAREYFDELAERVPLKREQTPEDIGKLAAFLASEDSYNITGQAINIDGGTRMN